MPDIKGRHRDVIVVGGGPAGLAAAVALKGAGVADVLVVERERSAGGTPRHCTHSPFGMREFFRVLTGPAYSRRLVDRALRNGVEVLAGCSVVKLHENGHMDVRTANGKCELAARRVILATGVREQTRSDRLIDGTRPAGVINTGAMQQILQLRGRLPFGAPLIVGTELVSFSALLSCRGVGIRPVAMIERESRTVAFRASALAARLLGVPLRYHSELVGIVGQQKVQGAVVEGADGKLTEINCDSVLLTGKFIPESSLMRMSHLKVDFCSGGPVIDVYGRCSDRSYFAAGNLLRPVESAGWCWREGMRIGDTVARDLAGKLADGEMLSVRVAPPVRYGVPQLLRADSASGALPDLQLRFDRFVSGLLQVSQEGRTVFSRKINARPEKRVLVKLARLGILASGPPLLVTLSEKRR